ncbi:MAG: glycosyltransferase [Planctomycetota bacterium]
MSVAALDGLVRAGKGMVRIGENLATGFLGSVEGWGSVVPKVQHAWRIPLEQSWGKTRDGAPRPDHAHAPGLDLIEVRSFTESMGRVEEFLIDVASRLRDGGTLVLDCDNLQSARMLRMVVEGRGGAFDPAGCLKDPSQPLLLRRLLGAAASAGLWVRDVLSVPTGAEEFAPKLSAKLCDVGLLPFEWFGGTPPARYWLVCERRATLAGSVLLAGGDDSLRAASRAALNAFLPGDWEIVWESDAAANGSECKEWNRAIAAARGDVIWFLRAGTLPSAADFEAMTACATAGPVLASRDGEPVVAGDVAGLMLPRLDALRVGPILEHFDNTCVALEEYRMRIDAKLSRPFLANTELTAPAAAVEHPEKLAGETASLLRSWSMLDGDSQTETPASAPGAIDPHPPFADGSAAVRRRPPVPWVGRAPRISLCMIARDEQRFLGRCLEAARGCYDELILVDTGSTDDTVAIAEGYGASVLHRAWDDDFSAPRNAGLAAATGDWVLVLDADEMLEEGAADAIRELVENPDALGYHLRFTNNYGEGKTMGVMMVRLFRNLPGIAYANVIHEQVTPSLQRLGEPQGLALLRSEIEVEHYGYSDAVMRDRSKNERNERLFLKQIAQTPDDIYASYKYGDFLRRVPGRGEDARRELDRCFDLILAAAPTLPRGLPYAGEVGALCALEAERAGDHERSREVVDMALRRFVPTPNLHYIAASLAVADGEAEYAIQHYQRCLSYRDCVLVVPIQEGITSYVSLAGIAQAWLLRGDRDRARRLLEQAIRIEPSYEVAQMALSRLWLEAGDVQQSLSVMTDFLGRHPNAPGACQQTMLILHRIGQNDAARAMGEHARKLLEARCLDREAETVTQLLAKI